MTVGVGVVTYNRPGFAERCVKSILSHCATEIDHLMLYDDCSDSDHYFHYKEVNRLVRAAGGVVKVGGVNRGVAFAKNELLRYLTPRCDWIILVEDDMHVTNVRAVTGYVGVANQNGLHHLSFAHHGPANLGMPVEVCGDVTYWPNYIGSWCLFSKEVIEVVGMFDEGFVNAFEHVEHEMRIHQAGYSPNAGPRRCPDATGSASWLAEQPDSIRLSAIRQRADWSENIQNAYAHWEATNPDTYKAVFG